MIARTAGPCVGDCGGRIHPGDEIEGVPGEGWRHVECGHVDTVHFEALDQSRWYANVYLNDGQVWTLNFGAKNPAAHGYANAEQIQ